MMGKKKKKPYLALAIRTLGAILALALLSACTSTGELDLSPTRLLTDLRCVSALANAGIQTKNETRSLWEIVASLDKSTTPTDVLAACAGLLENLEKTSQGIKARSKPEPAPEAPTVPNPAPRSSIPGVTRVSLVSSAPSAWQAPVFPWKTFSGMVNSAIGQQLSGCPSGGEVYMASLADSGHVFVMLYAPASNRLVFFYDPAPENPTADPTAIGYGQVDPTKHDEVPALSWHPYDTKRASGVCDYLYPAGTSI